MVCPLTRKQENQVVLVIKEMKCLSFDIEHATMREKSTLMKNNSGAVCLSKSTHHLTSKQACKCKVL